MKREAILFVHHDFSIVNVLDSTILPLKLISKINYVAMLSKIIKYLKAYLIFEKD